MEDVRSGANQLVADLAFTSFTEWKGAFGMRHHDDLMRGAMSMIVDYFIDAGLGDRIASFEDGAVARPERIMLRTVRRFSAQADSAQGTSCTVSENGEKTGYVLRFHFTLRLQSVRFCIQ